MSETASTPLDVTKAESALESEPEFSPEVEYKYQMITQELEEVLGNPTTMKKIIQARPYRIYWGTAPTGEVHIGYFKPMIKLMDFLKAGCELQVLLADIHAFLDNMKSSPKQLEARTKYYELVIRAILQSFGADLSQIQFRIGSEFQYTPEYRRDEDMATAITTTTQCRKAGAEVVKASDHPTMASLRYPILQALDEVHLKVDAQFGGSDQRKIFILAQELLPKLKYPKRAHLMNFMVKALSKVEASENTAGGKMSASGADSMNIKIDLLDTPKQVRKKLGSAFCRPGEAEDNTPLDLLEHVLFPLLQRQEEKFMITRSEEHGGDLVYEEISQVRADFASEKLHPADLKSGLAQTLTRFLTPIQEILYSHPEFPAIFQKAYGRKLIVPPQFKVTASTPTSLPVSA